MFYLCKHCLTVYDQTVGDPTNNIVAGTHFNELPARYECSWC
ncbi:MAG: rubredoxin [Chitinophagaceae bacterium]|nr:rubredoxin [Chitinophagaceae bacterium]